MAKFPKLPMFKGINAPSRIEVDIHDLEVEGDIPLELDGAFYRVAPDPQFPPRFSNDVPFNLDGTVSMFRFQNGRVDLKHRYVRTDKFKLEREAGGLKAPVKRVTVPDVSMPYAPNAERRVLPNEEKIVEIATDLVRGMPAVAGKQLA